MEFNDISARYVAVLWELAEKEESDDSLFYNITSTSTLKFNFMTIIFHQSLYYINTLLYFRYEYLFLHLS